VSELWTEDPRIAAVYDTECRGRRDHDFYVELVEAVGARAVVDVGCGTGVFAVDLARRGYHVTGVDPAPAMLDVARTRAGGDRVTWIHGDASDVPSAIADLVVMMGHVAQYFVDDDEWANVLGEARRILRPGGRLTFETRNPAIDWRQRWTRGRTVATHPHPDGGTFTAWVEMLDVRGSDESYTTVHAGHTVLPDGSHLVCAETLRFRSRDEIMAGLGAAGFDVEDAWGDWDRTRPAPSRRELIVLAHSSPAG
jgi:SAM-dependent methyltransferase